MVLSNKKLKENLRDKFAEVAVSKTTDFKTQTNSETPKSLKQLLDSTTPKTRLSKREKRRLNPSSSPKNTENDGTHVEESIEGGKKRKREKEGVEIGGKIEAKIKEKGVENIEKIEANITEKGVENIGKFEAKIRQMNGVLSESLRLKREKRKARREKKENNDLGDNNIGVDVEKGVENGKKIEENDVEMGVKEGIDLKKDVKEPVKNKKKKKKKKNKKSKKKLEDEEDEKQSEVENGGISEQIVVETSEGNDDDDKKKVYVGGMPYSSTEDDIWNYFDHCGAITDIDCLKFPDSGKFRGIAIISFKTEEAAAKALALDGSDMEGLYLKIQPYKTPRTPKSTNFSPPVIEGYNRIYAGNLSWDITEDDLRKFFSDCNILSIRFGEDKETGEFKGYAHVDFSDSDSLTKALKRDQMVVSGRPMKISRAVPARGPLKIPVPVSTQPAVKPQENKSEMTTDTTTPESNTEIMAVKPREYNSVLSMPVAPQAQENTSGVSSGKLKRRTCYECGEKGHISSACPKKLAADQTEPSKTPLS